MKRFPAFFCFAFSWIMLPFASGDADGLLEAWVRDPSLTADSDFLAFHHGGAPMIAVGRNGAIATSVDGIDWTLRNSGTSADLTGVTYGNRRYVAVSGDHAATDPAWAGAILTSPDGADWTVHYPGVSLRNIIFAEGRFVAAGESGIYISDDGVEWHETYAEPMEDVAYDGTSYAAVGFETFLLSPDAQTWAGAEGFSPFPNQHLHSVIGARGEWVAIGEQFGSAAIFYRFDGDSWSSEAGSSPAPPPFGVLYHSSLDALIGWNGGIPYYANQYFSSRWLGWWPEGDKPIPFNHLASSGSNLLAAGEGLSIWRNMVSTFRPLQVLLPQSDWELLLSSAGWSGPIHGVGEGGGATVLAGEKGRIAASFDGNGWSVSDTGISTTLVDAAYHYGRWIVVGEHGVLLTSDDAETWSQAGDFGSHGLRAISSGESAIVAVGEQGAVWVSDEGIEWEAAATNLSGDLNGVVFGQGRFVAAGSAGLILTSADGIEWSEVDSGTVEDLWSVTYGDGRFVVAGDNGTIFTSETGDDWLPAESGTTESLRGIRYAHGAFVAIADEPEPETLRERSIFVSRHGTEWEERFMVRRGISAVGFGNGRFLLGGVDGILFYSPVIAIAPQDSQVSANGGSYEISLTGAESWVVSGLPDWVSVAPMSGDGDATLTVDVSPNLATNDRRGTAGIAGVSHTIHQDGAGYRVDIRVSGRGSVAVTPDPEEGRLPQGTLLTIEATPPEEFIGWSGIPGAVEDDPVLAIELEEDLNITARFRTTTHLSGVVRFNGEVFVSGRREKVLSTETDGFWHERSAGYPAENWTGIAASEERLVMVGRNGNTAVSKDGRDWQTVWGVSLDPLSNVAYLAGSFWATGESGRLMHSFDGVYWDLLNTGTRVRLRGIAHDESTNVFAVVGDEGTILTSEGGGTWTVRESDWSGDIQDVASGPDGFVAIARGGTVLRSDNGESWTLLPETLGRDILSAVDYGNGRYVISAGMGRDTVMFVSEDAENWMEVEVPLAAYITGLAFDGERFLAAGYHASVLESDNGVDWEILHTSLETDLWTLAEGPTGELVAAGEHGQVFVRSSDGDWERVLVPNSSWLFDISFGGEKLVAVGDRGTILHSTNGIHWERAEVPATTRRIGGVNFGQGKFIAVGEEGTFYSSVDGETWEAGALPVSSMFWAVAHGDETFVAVGEGGAVAVSADGEQWEDVSIEEEVSLYAVVFHEDDGFVIAGSSGFFAHSESGYEWTVASPQTDKSWEALASGAGLIVGVGGDGVVALSAHGKEWTVDDASGGNFPLSYPYWLNAVIVRQERGIAAGAGGLTHTFPLPPRIRNHSGDAIGELQGEVLLSAEAAGTGPFVYQWMRGGVELPGETEPLLYLTDVERDAIGDYFLQVMGEGGEVVSAPFFVVVLTDYDTWAAIQYGDADSESAAPDVDPVGTGLANLLAYAFDASPESARSLSPYSELQSLLVDDQELTFLTFTYPSAIGADDIMFIPEVSGDLYEWELLPVENIVFRSREGTREFVTVRDSVSMEEGTSARFFRLRVKTVE